MKRLLLFVSLLLASAYASRAQDSTAVKLSEAGFLNVRSAETDRYRIYTIENDRFKIKAEGIAHALDLIDANKLNQRDPVKLIVTDHQVPQLMLSYDPEVGHWVTTSRLDDSWNAVRKQKKLNSSFGKVDIVVYPQVALMNLIITQVYQSLWQLSPALEMSLWPGMKFSYQLKFPIYNDGYGMYESKIHPGMVTLSQRFRDPWNLNVFGKLTAGSFSNARYGIALEMKYIFPNERFSVDTQLGYLGSYYYDGFKFKYDTDYRFRWNVAANYYWPMYQTQFTLRAQQFLMGDYGVKAEMIRHFRHCSIGFYAMKGEGSSNGGFRFQIAIPPYRMKRHGYWPKVNTSGQMGMVYNAGNERYFYMEYKTEASDNIMTGNEYNPIYVAGQIGRYRE